MRRIQKNLHTIQEEIFDACNRVGRDSTEIKVMAVTKHRSVEEINEVLDAGISKIGENRIQEAETKLPTLESQCEKHFIGHLQSNKINKALDLFDVIHAVDSVNLARKINTRAKALDKIICVFLEVNTSEEPQKFGFRIEELDTAFQEIHFMENVDVCGFMTMPKNTEDESELRRSFDMLYDTRDFIKNKHFLDTEIVLSMGMSNDFQIAIEQGADMVRIGRKIFA